jgi:Transglycosylase SLT domain
MRFLACLLLLLPTIAMAGQDVGPRPSRLIGPTRGIGPPRVTDSARLCEAAVTSAEAAGRLPPRMLAAISLTESGRIDPATGALRAWPWTINAEGEGRFFASKRDAIAAVTALQARGVQSIDVGCTQVNLMYHPHAFASLAAAFDPATNALYAARFLNDLYAAGRSWPRAIAAYHSETPALGEAYRVLVIANWQKTDAHDRGLEAVNPGLANYRDFAPIARAYNSFAPRARAYNAFAAIPPSR